MNPISLTPAGSSPLLEPARIQFIEQAFGDLLGAGGREEAGREKLLRWVHQRLFTEGAPLANVRQELSRQVRRTRVFAVTSGKGGVGKTTFAVNFAVACALRGLRVLLCDADLGMANVHVFAGLNPAATLLDVMDGRAQLGSILTTGPAGVEVLCGASGIGRMADLSVSAIEGLGRELLRLAADFDVLVIDTGAGIANSVMHFLGLAQDAIVVATPNLAATLDAYGVIKLAREQRLATRMHLLVNQADNEEQAGLARNRIAGCTQRFLRFTPGDLGCLFRSTVVERANQNRQPLMLAQPKHRNARRITEIATTLLSARWQTPLTEPSDAARTAAA